MGEGLLVTVSAALLVTNPSAIQRAELVYIAMQRSTEVCLDLATKDAGARVSIAQVPPGAAAPEATRLLTAVRRRTNLRAAGGSY